MLQTQRHGIQVNRLRITPDDYNLWPWLGLRLITPQAMYIQVK